GAAPQNYASIIDTRGRLTNRATGPSATLRITAPANSPVTLALNTYGSGRGHSDQLLYCTLNEAALVDCGTVTTMIDSSQQVIRIDNTGLPETTYTVFMQTMTPGYFRIDSFQVILGDVLTEGLYDNHFFSEDGLIKLDSNANWQMPPTRGTKVRGTIGGEVIRTQTEDAEFTFAFTGSGFSIITIENVYRPQIEICYVPLTEFESNGFESDKTVCRLSASEITRGSYTQYALNFYGLQPNTYKARVKVVGPVTDLRRQWFQMDALVIFADVTSQGALQPGMYDDVDLLDNPSVRFAPEVFWGANTRVRSGPPRGPWQLTEQQASNSGAVLQVFVEGNMLTLYQQVTSRNSNDVQACLVVFGTKANELQCNNFSQSGRGTYFTPVAFFGLGEGEHQIILENKAPRRNFNVDAIRVAP
ncbi:MAG: hypothetical protein K8J31_18395, partial [Anaerolineae bacterium]|nr:hypothetical protein [Anaerolineae bacterium]